MEQYRPYSDQLMTWDEARGRYYLTETALERKGIHLRARLARSKAVSPETVINGILNRVTDLVYGYIHSFNAQTDVQDRIIAEVPEVRRIFFRALENQALYMCSVGDLSLSTDSETRAKAIDVVTKQELETVIPGLGAPLTYNGVWRIRG